MTSICNCGKIISEFTGLWNFVCRNLGIAISASVGLVMQVCRWQDELIVVAYIVVFNMKLFKSHWLLYVLVALTLKNSAFWSQSFFYIFLILRINDDYVPKQHYPVGLVIETQDMLPVV